MGNGKQKRDFTYVDDVVDIMVKIKDKKNGKLILVTAITPTPAGEGKTTTIANLAITYANLGKRTLLVDSDLRKPVIHNIFSLDKSPGFTSYLSDNEKNIKKILKFLLIIYLYNRRQLKYIPLNIYEKNLSTK